MTVDLRLFYFFAIILLIFSSVRSEEETGDEGQDMTTDVDPDYDANSDESTIDVNTEEALGNIESTNVSLGGKFELLAKPCQRYDLELNYSAVKIEWERKHAHVDEILVTDIELSSSVCDINSFSYCNHNSKICLSNLPGSEVRSCLPRLYIYVYSSNFSNNSSENSLGKLNIKKIDGECDFASASEWDYCLALSDEKCRSDDVAVCDTRCKWVRCSFKNRKKNEIKKTVSECVPFTTIRKDDFCEDFEDEETQHQFIDKREEQTLFDFKYCGHALNFEILHPKQYSAGSIILFILVILLVLFILSICWYRWKITNHKQAPFTPPSCCPEWVYPRIHEEEYRPAPN